VNTKAAAVNALRVLAATPPDEHLKAPVKEARAMYFEDIVAVAEIPEHAKAEYRRMLRRACGML